MQPEPLRGILRSEGRYRIGRHRRRRLHVRYCAAVRASELESSVKRSLDLVALLVHRAVMPATE